MHMIASRLQRETVTDEKQRTNLILCYCMSVFYLSQCLSHIMQIYLVGLHALQSEHAVTSSETMKNLTVAGEYSSTCHVESKRLPYIAHIAASDYKCKPTVRNSKERQHFGFV